MRLVERPDITVYFDDLNEVAKTLNEINFISGGNCVIDFGYDGTSLFLREGSRVEANGMNFVAEATDSVLVPSGDWDKFFYHTVELLDNAPVWNFVKGGWYFGSKRALARITKTGTQVKWSPLDRRVEYGEVPLSEYSPTVVFETTEAGEFTFTADQAGTYLFSMVGAGGRGGDGSDGTLGLWPSYAEDGQKGGNNGGSGGASGERKYKGPGLGGGGGGSGGHTQIQLEMGNGESVTIVVGINGADTTVNGTIGFPVSLGGKGTDANYTNGGNGKDGAFGGEILSGVGAPGGSGDFGNQGTGGAAGAGYGAGGGGGGGGSEGHASSSGKEGKGGSGGDGARGNCKVTRVA